MANGHGGKRPGAGRPKGSRNKRTKLLMRALEEAECDPALILAKFATDESQEPEFRRRCAADLMPYAYPRLSATEITGEGGGPIEIRDQTMPLDKLPLRDRRELLKKLEKLATDSDSEAP